MPRSRNSLPCGRAFALDLHNAESLGQSQPHGLGPASSVGPTDGVWKLGARRLALSDRRGDPLETAATPAVATAPILEQLHDLERFRRFALLVNNLAIAETVRLVAEAEAQEEAKREASPDATILEADQRTPSCLGRLSTSPSTSMANAISTAKAKRVADPGGPRGRPRCLLQLHGEFDVAASAIARRARRLHFPPHPRCNSGSH